MTVDGAGNVYVADYGNHRLRKISPDGVVSTLAGDGTAASVDGTGSGARFYGPYQIDADASGNIYAADWPGNTIRKITPANVVTTLAGDGVSNWVDGSLGTASFNGPTDVVADPAGNLWVADFANHRIRVITP